MILTGRYKKQYCFECAEWYVEEVTGLYHCTKECEAIKEDIYLTNGRALRNTDLTLCEWCKDYLEQMEDLYYEPRGRPL